MRWMIPLAALAAASCAASEEVANVPAPVASPATTYLGLPLEAPHPQVLPAPPTPGAEAFMGLTAEDLISRLGRPNQAMSSDAEHYVSYVSSYCAVAFWLNQEGRVRFVLPSSPDEKQLVGIPLNSCLSSIRRERGLKPVEKPE